MTFDVIFQESKHDFAVSFGETQNISDGGYERGYAEGEKVGYANGYETGVTEGVEQGEKAEYDRFWDAFQQNGERTNYSYAFYGEGWNDDTYKPKYPLRPVNADSMFCRSSFTGRIDVDLSQCTSATATFSRVSCSEIGILDLRKLGIPNYFMDYARSLVKIEKIMIARGYALPAYCLSNVPLLTRVLFEGEIDLNWDMRNAPALDNESVQSVIDCLVDLTGQEAKKITFHSTVTGKLTPAQADAIWAKNWTLG